MWLTDKVTVFGAAVLTVPGGTTFSFRCCSEHSGGSAAESRQKPINMWCKRPFVSRGNNWYSWWIYLRWVSDKWQLDSDWCLLLEVVRKQSFTHLLYCKVSRNFMQNSPKWRFLYSNIPRNPLMVLSHLCFFRGMKVVLGVHPGPGRTVVIQHPPEIYRDAQRQSILMLLKLPHPTKIKSIPLPPCPPPANL